MSGFISTELDLDSESDSELGDELWQNENLTPIMILSK